MTVVVIPLWPKALALAVVAPKLIVPVVPVAVPGSMLIDPELLVEPEALPLEIFTAPLLVLAVEVASLVTPSVVCDWKAYGTALNKKRGVISPSQVGVAVWVLPPMFKPKYCCWSQRHSYLHTIGKPGFQPQLE